MARHTTEYDASRYYEKDAMEFSSGSVFPTDARYLGIHRFCDMRSRIVMIS